MFGWKKDPPDLRDRHALTLIAGVDQALDEPSHLRFRGKRIFQGRAGACVSFAKTRAVQLIGAMHDKGDDMLISPLFDYWVGRKFEHAGGDPWKAPPIEDGGQYPRVSWGATTHFGVVPWGAWPYEADKVLDDPPVLITTMGYQYRKLQWFRIFEAIGDFDVPRMVREISESMKRRASVCIGMMVDEAFTLNRGAIVESIDMSRVVGGHMMTVLEVRKDTVVLDNWWQGHGDVDGLVEIKHSCLGSRAVGDIIVTTGLPEGWR